MKKTLMVTLMLAALFMFLAACGSEETTDAGPVKKDAGPKDTNGTCTPDCSNKACGDDDGCGGKCVGSCPSGQTCNPNTYTCESCTPNCDGKACGDDDGCGGKCVGSCPSGQTCNPNTYTCESCTPNCSGKACGDSDGCGGKCVGSCPSGQTCNPNTYTCESCTPNCSGKACGDSDGCGGKCVGSCPSGQTCNPNTYTCEGSCTPNCSGKACGDSDGCGGKCVGYCPSGQTCNPNTYTCESTGNCVSKEGGACNIDNNPCCAGLACVTFADDQKDANCYKDCTNDQTVCSSTQQCMQWALGQAACFEVATISNGTFSKCPSYANGEEPQQGDPTGTASIKFTLAGRSYNFTMCAADMNYIDDNGNESWVIEIYDTSKVQQNFIYDYVIIIDPDEHTVGAHSIGETLGTVIYEIGFKQVGNNLQVTRFIVRGFGQDGTINFTAVGTGNKAPTSGTLQNVLMVGYDYVICDNNTSNPCQ